MADFKALLHSGVDEAVSVNQRALVEKILARYSGESTVFRELLQNADDASASTVEIHFRTTPDAGPTQSPLLHPKDRLPNLKTQPVTSIMVRNDGMVFRDEDWNRLKKIAEGNPDESKIGAFGVGWYSLFSLCEEPVVLSGSRMMQFYWKGGGDQLFVKTASDENGIKNATKDGEPWTTILVDLREQAPMPEPTDFARFLTTCLAFTSSLRTISMHFDGHLLFRISKTLAPSRLITLRPNLASTSPLKILHLTSIFEVPLQLRAEVSRWLSSYAVKPKPAVSLAAAATATSSFATKMLAAFSKPRSTVASPPTASLPSPSTRDPLDLLLSTLFLRTVSAELRVTPSTHFSGEMLRATKKALPKSTTYSLIWTGKDEFDAGRDSGSSHEKGKGVEGDEDARKMFAGLLSDLETNGRVFIGFPTFQTTGCAASVAARFVSTVERESLDFQARHVADWNRELLWAGGILARTVYEEELADIARLFASKGLSDEGKTKLQGRALHLLKFFTFSLSTPSPVVGSETETSFFATNSNSVITVISQLGPLPASQVRLPNPQLASFLKEVPTVPEAVSTGAPRFLAALRDRNLVRDISLEDVLADLATHPLKIEEAEHCFKWWISLAADRSYNSSLLSKLKEAAMISISNPDTRIYPLAGYKTFLNPKLISVDLPLPEHTLPFALTRSFAATDLSRVFQFEELSLLEWVRYLLSLPMTGVGAKADTNLLVSPHFAEKVLNTLARGWPTLSLPRHAELSTLLAVYSFLPTRQGPHKPTESYFANVLLFDDLPIVTLPSGVPVKGNLEKLLTALGVRRHVELQLVFTRLLGQGDWSHVDLVKYLVSVRDTLSSSEVDRLRKTAWLPKEGGAAVVDTAASASETVVKPRKVVRFTASQLFEPTDSLRTLGLPIVDWSTGAHKWRTTSDEARFLFELGLQRTPAVDQILQIAALTDNPSRQDAALRYFLDEYSTAGFDKTYSPTTHALPFVPAVRNDKLIFAKPAEVVSNVAASLLGFAVLANRMQNDAGRLKIAQDPPPSELVVALLKSPPASLRKARDIFGYMSSQVSRLSSSDVATLRTARIIPVERAGGAIELTTPSSCFFAADTALPVGLKAIFTTLSDFGPAAKPFLVAIGVKATPSPAEVAVSVVDDPGRFFDLCGSADRYLAVLRMLALNYGALSSTLRSRMKMSAFFLGSMRISTSTSKKAVRDDEDDDEEAGSLIYKLATATELAVNDDPQTFRVFQNDILACPQEDSIEAFAEALGASRISQLVTEHYLSTGEPDMGSKRAAELRRAVTERAFLFLAERRHQYGKGELKHDAEWIQSHLHVSEVRSIELVRTLTTAGTLKKDTKAASAYAKLDPKGDVRLFVSSDLELDYYEVAIALCRLLLSKQRPNDALLFMTILSTTLKNLKRRGFNVDRILNARQVDREAAEQRLREERLQAQLRSANALSPEKLASHEKQLGSLFPDADPSYLRSLLQGQSGSHVENAANQLLFSNYPKRPPPPPVPTTKDEQRMPGSDSGLFGNLKRKLRPETRGASSMDEGSLQGLSPPNLAPAVPPRTGVRPSSTATETPTSTDAIRSNVLRAIQASRPEASNAISNAVEKTQVKESESSYCDSTAAADLVFAAKLGGLRFFVAREILNPPDFVRSHHAALLRFITLVVRPVGEVFGVDPRALHIFHDLSGPLIAFNRNGSLYLNLRYYLAWHDEAVVRGELAEPLISVFHTLAHELAHNLVGPHDAEHSFYFSSLCEEKFLSMAALLATVRAAPLVEI